MCLFVAVLRGSVCVDTVQSEERNEFSAALVFPQTEKKKREEDVWEETIGEAELICVTELIILGHDARQSLADTCTRSPSLHVPFQSYGPLITPGRRAPSGPRLAVRHIEDRLTENHEHCGGGAGPHDTMKTRLQVLRCQLLSVLAFLTLPVGSVSSAQDASVSMAATQHQQPRPEWPHEGSSSGEWTSSGLSHPSPTPPAPAFKTLPWLHFTKHPVQNTVSTFGTKPDHQTQSYTPEELDKTKEGGHLRGPELTTYNSRNIALGLRRRGQSQDGPRRSEHHAITLREVPTDIEPPTDELVRASSSSPIDERVLSTVHLPLL
ncbi:hypothetical protein WMY93_029896 [Mugilogobius chulae]|uniref:Uncharacterized protein n=1 Tax=Mugilogobius chulae TaxID=88201 RepID=A0AAW0MW98_9GOBI